MKKIIIFVIKKYQKYISPVLKNIFHVNCKYYPTCSEYFLQAVNKYGAFRGSFLGIKRILKCNPFSKGGVDTLR